MTDEERRQLIAALRSDTFTLEMNYQAADELERLAALEQSDAEPIKWLPDANMRAELDRSELVARALLKEIMKQIDCIEAEGNIEWHKRIKLNGELYLPDLAVAVLAVLYTTPPRPDASDAGWTSRQSYSELKGWHWVDDLSANPPWQGRDYGSVSRAKRMSGIIGFFVILFFIIVILQANH